MPVDNIRCFIGHVDPHGNCAPKAFFPDLNLNYPNDCHQELQRA